MKRRQILAGVGGIAASSGLLVGSGAFTSTGAARTVTVDVADDENAFLHLDAKGPGGRSSVPGDKLRFDIPGAFEDEHNPSNPKGVGTDSVYRFGRDAGTDEPGLFQIQNQGTQPVTIWSSQAKDTDENGNELPDVAIYNIDNGDVLREDSASEAISTGEKLLCGLWIDTHGVDIREESYNFNITINAAAEGE